MKKVLSLFLSIVMLLSITAGVDLSAYAANGIETKISSIKSKYPSGSYFSGNGKACSHKQYEKCSNCKLSTVSSTAAKACGEWWTCQAFARYVFFTVFGISPQASSNTIKTVTASNLNSTAKYGDFVECISSSGSATHAFIYLGSNGSKHYRYESNYGVANKVNYKTNCPAAGQENPATVKYKIYHASNYDKINGTTTTTTNVTITFNGNGGTPSSTSLTVAKGGTMGHNIPTATWISYYVFDGWYTAANGGTKYTNSTKINSNITLYAHWLKVSNYSSTLKSGRVYRIICKKSGMALQANGSSLGSLVRQQKISDSKLQFWRCSEQLDNIWTFNNMYGGGMLSVQNSSMSNKAKLEVNTALIDSKRMFALISRGSGYYSIHPTHSDRSLDIESGSTSSGAQLQQYYYTGEDQQLFYFQEITTRSVKFYDNLSNNYLPTPREVYNHSGGTSPKDCYVSRNTDYVTTSVNAVQNKLTITSKKAGSSGNDMTFATTVNGSYNYDLYDRNTNTMYLCFTAKSSVQGAKMYFRWGYDDTSAYKSITLNTTATNYIITLPRTLNSGSNIHPYVDKACTIEMTNIQLKSDSTASVDLSSGDTFSHQSKTYDVNNNSGTYGTLPQPTSAKSGYIFDGWYTDRIGGAKVTASTSLGYNTKLYAHWVKATDTNHTHTYNSGVVTKAATCTETGTKTYTCTICNTTKTETIPATGHEFSSSVQYCLNGCGTANPNYVTSSAPSIGYTTPSALETITNAPSNTEATSATETAAAKPAGAKKVDGVWVNTKQKKAAVKKLTKAKKALKITWKKVSGVTGYQIQYSTSKKFTKKTTKSVTVSSNKAKSPSKTIKKLKSKKTYYVRIRTYKTVKLSGKSVKVYSSWSKVKSVKTK